jgi:hypothetical protein
MASYMAVSLAIGALCGWWARGKRRRSGRLSGGDRMLVDDDDLIALRDLSQEVLATQRGMVAQLNELAAHVELVGRRIEALVRSPGNIDSRSGAVVSREIQPRQTDGSRPDSAKIGGERDAGLRIAPAQTRDLGSADDWSSIEAAAREFLISVDSKEFDNVAVGRFFAERETAASFVLQFENRWAVIAVHSPTTDIRALGIPAIRVAMRQIDLQPYFDFVNYNGLDPIRGAQVVRLAHLTRASGKWTTTQKGIIDGSR